MVTSQTFSGKPQWNDVFLLASTMDTYWWTGSPEPLLKVENMQMGRWVNGECHLGAHCRSVKDQGIGVVDFILVDGMPHAVVHLYGHIGSHGL